MVIETGSGSREPAPNVSGNLMSSAIPVLAFMARRRDLRAPTGKQLGLADIAFISFAATSANQDQAIGNYVTALLPFTAIP